MHPRSLCISHVSPEQVLWSSDDGTPHVSEHAEPFRVLPLEIAGCETVEAALQAYVAGEPLHGYVLPDHSRVDALKRTCLRALPHTLVLQLKRFSFDYDAMLKLKIYDRCSFGAYLDMSPYRAEPHLRRACI